MIKLQKQLKNSHYCLLSDLKMTLVYGNFKYDSKEIWPHHVKDNKLTVTMIIPSIHNFKVI